MRSSKKQELLRYCIVIIPDPLVLISYFFPLPNAGSTSNRNDKYPSSQYFSLLFGSGR